MEVVLVLLLVLVHTSSAASFLCPSVCNCSTVQDDNSTLNSYNVHCSGLSELSPRKMQVGSRAIAAATVTIVIITIKLKHVSIILNMKSG